jgi:hypothetical protein
VRACVACVAVSRTDDSYFRGVRRRAGIAIAKQMGACQLQLLSSRDVTCVCVCVCVVGEMAPAVVDLLKDSNAMLTGKRCVAV